MAEDVEIEESEKFGRVVRTKKRQIPPNVTAQIFWLKNRKRKQWRDKPPEERETEGGGVIELAAVAEPEPPPVIDKGGEGNE